MKTKEQLIENVFNLKTKEEKIIFEIYTNLYRHINISFKDLVNNAEVESIFDQPQLNIPFDDYEIKEIDFNTIVDSILKTCTLPKWKKTRIRNSVLLGCSPKFSK